MYDSADREGYEVIKDRLERQSAYEYRNTHQVYLVSQQESVQETQVSVEEGQSLAREYDLGFFTINLSTGFNVVTVVSRLIDDLEELKYEEESRKSNKLVKNIALFIMIPFSWAAIPSLLMVAAEGYRYLRGKICRKRRPKTD
jgi:transaldolase